MKEKRSKIREKLSLRAVGLILAMSMVAGTLLPVGVGAEELPIDINNEEITVADVMMYEDTDMSEDEEENEAAAETEEVIDVVSEENSEEAPAETSEPEAAEPETTESEVSESEVSEPEVTEPEVPDFEETEPDEIITEEELPADAPEEEIYFCGIEKHEHTEECRNAPEEPDGEIIVEEEIPEEEPQPEEEPGELYCGYEVHVHDDTCWNEEYLADCGMEEHEHSENCYSLAYTLMAEFAAAVELFPDEADYILLDFDEADGSELLDEEAYYAAYAAFYEENPDIWATTDALYNEASEAFAAENPEGDLDTWLKDNGFWEAAEKFYWVVPMPEDVEAMIAQYEEAEEIELEITAEEEAPVMYANGTVGVVTNNVTLDATVKVFNYNDTVNTREDGLGPKGYSFFQGDYVKDDNGADKNEGSVDGVYNGDVNVYNQNNKPVLNSKLVNGYPYVDSEAEGSTVEIRGGSMAYLFSDTIDKSYHKGTMIDGGGLFQKDTEGYYYYDSLKNAAYFNGTSFTLYDTVVRPKYTDQADLTTDGKLPASQGNFLPFNEVAGKVTVDTSQKHTEIQTAHLNGPVDLWFGMTVEFEFFMPKDGKMKNEATGIMDPMVFDFHGDDDVFVYIDNVLVINLIGTHGAQSATVDFNTGKVVNNGNETTLEACFKAAGKTDSKFKGDTFADYTKHTLKFFYMERGGNISYCRLRFNMPTLPSESLTVGKELEIENNTNENITEHLQETLKYKFRVMKAKTDSDGNVEYETREDGTKVVATEGLLLEKGDAYILLDSDNNPIGDPLVIEDEDGYFELKAGQRAQFQDMWTKFDNLDTDEPEIIPYVVEELIPEALNEQYGGVEIESGGLESITVVLEEDGVETKYVGYQSPVFTTNETEVAVFENAIDVHELSQISITKLKSDGSTGIAENQSFEMSVNLGDKPIPLGTVYTIGEKQYTIEEEGIIPLKVGETAIITGILSGTKYEVYEVGGEEYYVTYVATVECTTHAPEGQKTCKDCEECCPSIAKSDDSSGAPGLVYGELSLHSSVEITVTNSTYDVEKTYDLYIAKQVTGNMGDQSKAFGFTVAMELPAQASMDELTVYAVDEAEVLYSIGSANDIVQKEANDIAAVSGNKLEFPLKHDEKYHVTGIPKGATITITEGISANGYSTEIGYYEVDQNGQLVLVDGTTNYEQMYEGVRTVVINGFTADYDGGYIVFTNDKTATIDTAVHLDYLPYILILTAVIPTMTLAVSRKRRRRED